MCIIVVPNVSRLPVVTLLLRSTFGRITYIFDGILYPIYRSYYVYIVIIFITITNIV